MSNEDATRKRVPWNLSYTALAKRRVIKNNYSYLVQQVIQSVAGFVLTSASCGPSAVAELLVTA